ncbi:hypothetical protein Q3G72_009928 [Acer saccharum]|nr:hypothetical protein Q3G72_009928 [Acer saccharum]
MSPNFECLHCPVSVILLCSFKSDFGLRSGDDTAECYGELGLKSEGMSARQSSGTTVCSEALALAPSCRRRQKHSPVLQKEWRCDRRKNA